MAKTPKKTKKSILHELQSKITKECEPYSKKLEKEKNKIKQLKLIQKIIQIDFKLRLDAIKKLSNKEWDNFVEEMYEPLNKQSIALEVEADEIVFKRSKNPKEFKQYENQKKVLGQGLESVLDILNDSNLNTKQLRRYVELMIHNNMVNLITQSQNVVNFNAFHEAEKIVMRRMGFSYDWLIGLSLIQLHENLIKKKLDTYGEKIKGDESINVLMKKLSTRFKKDTKLDISVDLLMTNGIKKTRDVMSHEGYKYPISKSQLNKICNELLELERIIYPEESKNVKS